MCRMFKISKSGYYNWLGRGPSQRWSENEVISLAIRDIFEGGFGSYGAPRIKAELSKKGYRISRPRAARIMRANNLFARRKRKFKITTDSKHNYPIDPNILVRNFTVYRKNHIWVSDITYIRTKQGWMYLTVIIDLFNRKVVGWSMSNNLGTMTLLYLLGIWRSDQIPLPKSSYFIQIGGHNMPVTDLQISLKVMVDR